MYLLTLKLWDTERQLMSLPLQPLAKDGSYTVEFENDGRFRAEDIPVTFMKCIVLPSTGLNDKHGKEIFDGHILRYRATTNRKMKAIDVVVEWSDVHAGFQLYDAATQLTYLFTGKEELEIVGNIYQNPERLAGAQ